MAQTIKDLIVYQKAYELAMRIFECSKRFPAEERFALTSQIRRSSRCDGESNETDSALDFARDCGYLSSDEHKAMVELNREVGKMIGAMVKNPTPFLCGHD